MQCNFHCRDNKDYKQKLKNNKRYLLDCKNNVECWLCLKYSLCFLIKLLKHICYISKSQILDAIKKCTLYNTVKKN